MALQCMPKGQGLETARLLMGYKEACDDLYSDLAKDYIHLKGLQARKDPIGKWQFTNAWELMDHIGQAAPLELGKLTKGKPPEKHITFLIDNLEGEIDKLCMRTEEEMQELRWLQLKATGE